VGGNGYFNGAVEEAMIFSSALSDSQIKSLYQTNFK
jgi:hypothetical protein